MKLLSGSHEKPWEHFLWKRNLSGFMLLRYNQWNGWLLIISFNKASKNTKESGIICKSN